MVKRTKRLEKGIESLKEEIEEHFQKLDKDISENNKELGRYHAKEIGRSLILALERKISLLGENPQHSELLKEYKSRLNEYKKKLKLEED
jgi:hypothetical protein